MQNDETEWSRCGISEIVNAEKVSGLFTFRDSELGNATITMTPEQEYLEPPKVPIIQANPSQGFAVHWSPVARAVGYKVRVRAEDDPYISWKNSNMDWLRLGANEALRQGVLLADTHCLVPAGIFQGPVWVDVDAVSKEVRGSGSFVVVGWAESSYSIEVGK
jgi:hypothetical protein